MVLRRLGVLSSGLSSLESTVSFLLPSSSSRSSLSIPVLSLSLLSSSPSSSTLSSSQSFRITTHRQFSVLIDDHNEDTSKKTTTDSSSTSTTSTAPSIPFVSFQGKKTTLSPGFDVRRLLPHYKQRSVGSFVFMDHFGPVDTTKTSMDVGPHPHIGLATLTYLYDGAIVHRDSTGADHMIIPGGVNYMVSGKGVVHSERGKPDVLRQYFGQQQQQQSLPTCSHGLQLWLALPKENEDVEPSFHSGDAVPLKMTKKGQDGGNSDSGGGTANLVIGEFNGVRSNIPMDPKMGTVFFLDIQLPHQGNTYDFSSDRSIVSTTNNGDDKIEIGFYVVSGKVQLIGDSFHNSNTGDNKLESETMTVFQLDNNTMSLDGQMVATTDNTCVAIVGGTALPEKRFMTWNFVSCSKEKIDRAIVAWGDGGHDTTIDRTIFPPVVNEPNDDSIPFPTSKRKVPTKGK